MYVSRLPLVELLRESSVQLGLGEGPIDKVGPMSQPRGTIDTASRTLVPTNARGVLGPTLLWAAKGDLIPHIGGVGSHRARVRSGYPDLNVHIEQSPWEIRFR